MSERKDRPARIALIQQADLPPDPERNKAALRAEIERLAHDADFIMPTELATTPYFGAVHDRGLEAWAETIDGPFVKSLCDIAARTRTTILLPLYLRRPDGSHADVVVVIGPDGRLVSGSAPGRSDEPYFTKVHLPSARRGDKGIDEPFYFERGDCFPVFETPQAVIGVLVCYDRRFPEAWRSLALAGAELVFMPACVPAWNPSALASTGDMFVAELQTRACENGVFVAACNRAGPQTLAGVESHFIGRSCIIDPAGGVIRQSHAAGADIISAEINLDDVRRVRRRLSLLHDRVPEAYNLDAPPPAPTERQA